MKEFEDVYSQYYNTVFQYVLSLSKDELLAEEITQKAFFKALKSIDSFRGDCKLSVWLCQIAKNTFYTAIKRMNRQSDYLTESASPDESIEQVICDEDTAFEIHKLLHSLDEPYKEVFWMRTFGELSFRDIGAIFGKTESWARVTYHRAKMKIKEGIK